MSLHKRRRRPQEPGCRPLADLCPWCGQNLDEPVVEGCVDRDIRGRGRLLHRWEPEDELDDEWRCRCGAAVGHFHHYGCSAEPCPWAEEHTDVEGDRLIGCGCFCNSCDHHAPGPHVEPGEPS